MSKPLRRDPNWTRSWMNLFILFLLPLMASSQDCDGDIMITGSNYVCENSTEDYGLAQTFPGQLGDWRLDPPGSGTFATPTIGNAVTIVWDQGPGTYDLIVEFTDYQAGCIGTFDDTLTIEVVSDFGRQLACNDTVQVSLGTDCQAVITPDMVLEGTRVMNIDYNVYVQTASGDTIPFATVNGDHIGQVLKVSVEHDCSTNSCWGWLKIEDKIAPMPECTDVMIGCNDDTDPVLNGVPGFPFTGSKIAILPNGSNSYSVSGIDACGPVTVTYDDLEEVQNCIGEATTSTLYSISRGGLPVNLMTLDTSDGSTLTSIPITTSLDAVIGARALATDPSTNELYIIVDLATMFGGDPTLAKVDATTGVLDIIGPLADMFSGLTFNSLGDKLYGVTGSGAVTQEAIFEINKYTAASTLVCNNVVTGPGEAIAFNTFTDELIHVSNIDDTLQIVNLNTCATTGIDLRGTPLEGDGRAPISLVFDPTTGDMIIGENNQSPIIFFNNTNLYRVGLDGSVSFIGQRFGRTKALAFVVNTPFINKITRTWTITDESGNSNSCTEMIQVRPQSLLAVVCPPNYDDFDQPALMCDGGFAVDKNGNPAPSVTGFPTGVDCSNIDYDYIDYRLGICESSYKIIREWLIADWCTGEQIYCNQIIKVLDIDGPQVSCPPNDTFSVRPFECLGDAIAPNPLNYILKGGECSQNVTVEVTVKRGAPDCTAPSGATGSSLGVFKLPNGDYRIEDLPQGCSWIIYTYTDDCGNMTSCVYDVFIKEDKKPVAICDQHTRVTLSTTGTAKVFASTFDDGSYDNCELDSFAVRRMTPGNCPTGVADDTQFRNYVEFCCADAGDEPLLVVFRVYDKSGNFNECMVEIFVSDKNPPVLICPPNITVSCEYSFANLDVFGQVRFNEADREKIIIDDQANPGVPRNNDWGIDGIYSDDCQADTTYRVVDGRNDCGVGTITRTWTVSDANTTRSCTQRITIRDFEPFNGVGIVFPPDRTLTSCPTDLDPDITGRPTLPSTGQCADLLVTYEDQVYNIVPDACYKVIRSWTVVDWCNNNHNTNRFFGTQVIKILNTQDPFFVSGCENQTFNTVIEANCTGIATLEVEVDDDCTPQEALVLEYKIDLYKDGLIDRQQVGDATLTATNSYPAGVHEICWTVEDKCGNRETCCYDFTMRDGKKPTPYCSPGIITVVMPSTGRIEIWASDFDDNSFDNCTSAGNLRFSFSSDVNDRRREYTCSDIDNGIEQSFEITVYVTDEAGNQDFCVTMVTIQDGIDDVCPDNITGNTVTVTGNITTASAESVEEVMVTLDGKTPGMPKYDMTGNDGQFAFPSIPADHNYSIGASRDDDPMNGVSTLDLVLIQRHLLGISSFNSPYQHIAADANNSNSVSVSDISELRKLILGHYTDFPRNESWRFVLKDFQFTNPDSPWPFEEVMEIDDVMNHQTSNDFIAVKTGDINGDVRPNGLIGNVVRSGKKLTLNTSEAQFVTGDLVEVSLDGSANDLHGLQLAVQFDASTLVLTDINHISGITQDGNIGLTQLQDGIISISWNAVDGSTRNINEGLISFTFEAVNNGTLSENFGLHTKNLVPEAYLTDMEVVDIEFNFIGEDGNVILSSEEFELFQNQPNPFDQNTRISFTLPRMEEASIHIFDVTGKTVHMIQGVFSKGLNEVTVGKDELSTSGVLYYRLETNDQMATRKMIMIE